MKNILDNDKKTMTDTKEKKSECDDIKYIVYRNDIKFKQHRSIDPSRALWASEDVKMDFMKNTDSIDYRIDECVRENCNMIDLSHMSNTCFDEFIKHPAFYQLVTKVQHIFAKDCSLMRLPSLNCFTNL